ncbi:ATP-binding protein [Stenotrophomonas maltophilia]|nr:ATP-binding protein [Stenotrophomonas maltophilia]
MKTTSDSLPSGIGPSIDRAVYNTADPVVKLASPPKGQGVIIGRSSKKKKDLNGLVYIGQVIENTPARNLLGSGVWLDIDYPHVIYISGTRGSGKSFDLGVILEGIGALTVPSVIQSGVDSQCSILLDMQNQFWTLSYEPRAGIKENDEQIADLKRWNLSPNSLSNCKVYIPSGTEAVTGKEVCFQLTAGDVLPEEWCTLIGQPLYSPQGHIISQCVEALEGKSYDVADMIRHIESSASLASTAESTRNAVIYKLRDVERTALFSRRGLDMRELLTPGRCSVLMIRDIRNEDKSIVAAMIARKMFREMGKHHSRKKANAFFGNGGGDGGLPSKAWLFIDEAHIVVPKDAPSPARDALVEYVKRGRDAGLSLVIATQQPSAIDDRILSQVNLSINHRLTFQSDISAASNRIPTKVLSSMKVAGSTVSDFGDMLRLLDSGECFVGDNSTSRTVIVSIRPRITSHGGYNPS